MKKIMSLAMILLVIFTLSLTFAPDAKSSISTLEVEQVTHNAWCDADPVIDLDSTGRPHIAWIADDGAYYAFKSDDSWSLTKISTDPPIPDIPGSLQAEPRGRISLCLDSQEHPHIAWAKPSYGGHPTGAQVFYSYWDGDEWITEQVTHWGTAATEGARLALALDSNDQPHIAWDSRYNGLWGVFYSEKEGADWTFEVISHLDDAHPSIVVDENGVPHVFWQALRGLTGPGRGLWLSSRIGGTWTTEQVVSGRSHMGGGQHLAIDSLGNPHIVFSTADYGVSYGYRNLGSWVIDEISDETHLNLYPSIALDPNDNPYVVWSCDATGAFDIYLAEHEQQWIVHNISNQLFDESRPRIAIGDNGDIHVAWYGPEIDQNDAEIYFARTREPTKWAVVIGVDEYWDPELNMNEGPSNSAIDMYEILVDYMNFPPDNIHLLLDKIGISIDDITRAMVEEELHWLQSVSIPEDIVVFYYAGHGDQDPASGNEYIVMHELPPMPDYDFSAEINKIESENLCVILDISVSGGVIKDGQTFWEGVFGVGGEWSDLASGTPSGRVVLTACAENVFLKFRGRTIADRDAHWGPFPSGRVEMVFTHFLVKGFEGPADSASINPDGKVTVEEAFRYARVRAFIFPVPFFKSQTPMMYDGYPEYEGEGELFLGD